MMMKSLGWVIAWWIGLGLVELYADSVPIPSVIAVLGDSISEGMLTDFSLEQPPTFMQWLGALGKIRNSLGGSGLSVMRALFAKAYHSWATGDDRTDSVFSHFERLKRLNPHIRAYNFAISGSTSQALDAQVSRLLQTEDESGQMVDYLIVLIGANDLNVRRQDALPAPQTYGFNVEMAIRRVLSQNPRRQLLLVSLPNIYEMMDQSRSFAVYSILGGKLRCDTLRRRVYGNRVLFAQKGTEAYQAGRMMAELYRDELARVAEGLQSDFPAAAIKTLRHYDTSPPDYKALSVDCFHPSTLGQAQLAELTWRQSFWADLVTEGEEPHD